MHYKSLQKIGFILFLMLPAIHGAKIMMLTVFGSKSTTNHFQFLAEILVDKGHEVVFVLLDKTVKHSPANITYITFPQQANFDGIDFSKVFFQYNPLDIFPLSAIFYQPMMVNMCKRAYNSKALPELLAYKGQIDLVIFDYYMQDCFLPAIHSFNAPIIFYHGNVPESTSANILQIPTPYSYVQNIYYHPRLPMNFLQRTWNSVTHFVGMKMQEWLYYPAYEKINREFLPNSPSIGDIIQNVTLLMGSFDTTWGNARPSIPKMMDITCAHCTKSKPLPQDINKLVDESGEHGFIIFAMGTFFEAEFFPPGYLELFLKVFSRLKQTVIWKRSPLDNLPDNVKTFSWLPQQDLIGHPKAKLFITHGGMYSILEAVYHGVPMIGMGVFADQEDNLLEAQHKGIALSVNRMDITEDKLYNAITTVLEDPSYKKQAKKFSEMMQDQPTTPLQRALYGIEYVLKHGDVTHLRGPNANISLFEYYSIDVIICLNFILIFVTTSVYLIVKKCLSIIKKMV